MFEYMYRACILLVYNIVTVEAMTLEGLIPLLNFEGKTKVFLSSNSDKILVFLNGMVYFTQFGSYCITAN